MVWSYPTEDARKVGTSYHSICYKKFWKIVIKAEHHVLDSFPYLFMLDHNFEYLYKSLYA
jgi:hypothetical protein